MDWRAKGGKSALIRILHSLDFSFRTAEQGVNAVFDILTDALKRGESVEVPGGILECHTVTRARRFKFSHVRDIRTGEREYRLLRFRGGPQRRIRFRPDPRLDFTPPPAKPEPIPRPAPPTPTPQEIDIKERLTRLLPGAPINSSFIDRLTKIVEDMHGPHRPDSLQMRLRELDRRGRQYTSELRLVGGLQEIYWC